MIQLNSIRLRCVYLTPWSPGQFPSARYFCYNAQSLPMVMTLPPFLCGYNFPGKLWRSISRRKAGVRFVFSRPVSTPLVVVHSLCKYVTTCYNYNPNYRWNLILLSPCFSGFQPATARACNGRHFLDGLGGLAVHHGSETWRIPGLGLDEPWKRVGAEIYRHETNMYNRAYIYIYTYNIGKLYIYTHNNHNYT